MRGEYIPATAWTVFAYVVPTSEGVLHRVYCNLKAGLWLNQSSQEPEQYLQNPNKLLMIGLCDGREMTHHHAILHRKYSFEPKPTPVVRAIWA